MRYGLKQTRCFARAYKGAYKKLSAQVAADVDAAAQTVAAQLNLGER